MKSTQSTSSFLIVGCAALLVSACTSQMEPAQQALVDINRALAAASPDATKYIPDQVASVQGKLTDLDASYDKQDYAAVLAGAPAVLAEAKDLASAAAAKKAEIIKSLKDEWTGLEASLPPLVAAVKTRVDALSKKKRVAKGVDLAAAKSSLADATALWDKAQAAYMAGKVEDAVPGAKDAQAKAESAAAALRLKLPGGSWSTQSGGPPPRG